MALETHDAVSSARLKVASSHWILSFCNMNALEKVPLNGVQKLLGHASIAVKGAIWLRMTKHWLARWRP